MNEAALVVVAVVVVVSLVVVAWWGSTIALMSAARGALRPIGVVAATTPAFLGACVLARASASRLDTVGDAMGFVAALLAWACAELMFLTGVVVGPRRTPCPPVGGVRRFAVATQAVIHHELLLVGLGLAVAVCGDGDNRTARFTFAALWALRLSAKLHLFAGVPVPHAELLPPRVAYLASYFGSRRPSAALWVSIAGWLALVVVGVGAALARGPRLADGLILTLAALGVMEHVFLAVDLGDARLWALAIPTTTTRPVRDGHSSPI